jgi:hypothetical protein
MLPSPTCRPGHSTPRAPCSRRARRTGRRVARRTHRPAACSLDNGIEPSQRRATTVPGSGPTPRTAGSRARARDVLGRIPCGAGRGPAHRGHRRARNSTGRPRRAAPIKQRAYGRRLAAGRPGRAHRRLPHGRSTVPRSVPKTLQRQNLAQGTAALVVAGLHCRPRTVGRRERVPVVAPQRPDRPGNRHAQRAIARTQNVYTRARVLR